MKNITIENNGVIKAIGNTPMVELLHLNKNSKVRIMAKLEGANPSGSVKDRPAFFMIKNAIESGLLTRDKIILEPTSGNTGIGLAMVGAALGYRVKLCMPECVSFERRAVLQAFGGELVLTDGSKNTDGAILKAHEMLEDDPDTYFMPDQYSNPCNVLAHYETTGPEIIKQTDGEITAFVAALGTTGTIMGVSKRLREYNPEIKIAAVEPPLGHSIQGLKNMQEAIVPKIYNPDMHDKKIVISDEEAFETSRLLAIKEGLFCGMSSGAAVAGALKFAQELGSGTIVTILPDRGDRYLSTTLFKSVCAKCPP
jgi:S-sulfo-L-cysteine synthase (O-acetyl-L-serine-dependent)